MEKRKKLFVKTAEELLNTDYPVREAIIPDLINVGCYLLAGSPKIGKSYLALQIGMCVSTGKALWGLPLQQSNVLYLALEDSFERLQRRYAQISDYKGNEHLMFAVEAPSIVDGLTNVVKECYQSFNFRLLMIDALQMIRSNNQKVSYSDDYQTITAIRNLAYELNIAVLLIHHTRKLEAEDEFDRISGTNGLFGASDGGFILYKKKRSDNEAKLICTGRDIPYMEKNINFNSEKFLWECEDADTKNVDSSKDLFLEKINTVVSKHGGHWIGTPTDLHQEIDYNKCAVNKLTMRLKHNIDKLRKLYNIEFEYKLLKQKTIILNYIVADSAGEKDNA